MLEIAPSLRRVDGHKAKRPTRNSSAYVRRIRQLSDPLACLCLLASWEIRWPAILAVHTCIQESSAAQAVYTAAGTRKCHKLNLGGVYRDKINMRRSWRFDSPTVQTCEVTTYA
jgi:hypothetical protein